jgi:hypothetical protein
VAGPLGLGLAAAVVVLVALSGTSDAQLVENAVNGYFGTSGPDRCNFLDTTNIHNNYTDLNTCRQRNQGAQASL